MRRLSVVLSVAALTWVTLAPPASAAAPTLSATKVQTGLTIPWDVDFSADGRMLVTERPGRVRVYASGAKGARLLRTTRIPDVRAEGEAGVMGIATARRNGKDLVFVCASRVVNGAWRNQVLRFRLGSASRLRFEKVVLRGMRAATTHNGCPVEVGPDGKLWVGMGDAADLSLPQRRTSRNGKILRVNLSGSIPADNPFEGSPVYSLGHRNPQGIAFRANGRAYAVEHGPSVNDEVNLLAPGRNYGWPCWTGASTPGPRVTGCGSARSYRSPVWASGSSTIATSGGAFVTGPNWGSWRGNLFVATLKEKDLRRFAVSRDGTAAYQRSVLFDERFGRLRAVVRGPGRSHALFATTSNGSQDSVVRIRARH